MVGDYMFGPFCPKCHANYGWLPGKDGEQCQCGWIPKKDNSCCFIILGLIAFLLAFLVLGIVCYNSESKEDSWNEDDSSEVEEDDEMSYWREYDDQKDLNRMRERRRYEETCAGQPQVYFNEIVYGDYYCPLPNKPSQMRVRINQEINW